ncbi:MAG TPA: DNA cytosine methyltransferase [Luteimonas sp.]|nr:DNA cytosine methyltransferase [Luteimonas sp.]
MKQLNKRKKPIAIDLFSGCGGLSVGLARAGFTVVAACEIDEKAAATYTSNHPNVKLYRQDVRKLRAARVLNDLCLKKGDVDLLAGCPPCQGFSRMRTKNGGAAIDDARNNLVSEFLRFVRTLRPKMLMLENVPGLRADYRLQDIVRELPKLGYEAVVEVLDAADYSVPQRRKRMILLASRIHNPVLARKANRKLTVKDAIGLLEPPAKSRDRLHSLIEHRSDRVRELIRHIPKNGGSRSDLPARFKLTCHKGFDGFADVYGRMRWGDVSPTITSGCTNPSKGRFLHPSQNRAISLREAALLQGFPRGYKFDISHGKEAISLMIGNALPPPFIEAHAKALMKGLKSAA